jgi:porphobilinogen synthase
MSLLNHRRIRANTHIRSLAANVRLSHLDFIQPLFVEENLATQTPITSLSGINTDTLESLIAQIRSDIKQGICKFLLFPILSQKRENNFDYTFIINVLKEVKKVFGTQIWIAMDVCLCAYTSHGHCGILNDEGTKVLNKESVKTLAEYSLELAKAGADCIAPSDMMDGRIGAIRQILDENNCEEVSILSYSAKFSSQFYGPFRDACKSSPDKTVALKDRKTYQCSPSNAEDALLSTYRDLEEGADIVMVKPSVVYLDVIKTLSQNIQQPIAAYHVSGEYQSLELLAQHNLVERHKAHLEIWTALKRGGATIIISYAARFAKEWIENTEY